MISIGVLRRIRSLRIVFLSILSISKIDAERFERNALFRCAFSKLNECTNFVTTPPSRKATTTNTQISVAQEKADAANDAAAADANDLNVSMNRGERLKAIEQRIAKLKSDADTKAAAALSAAPEAQDVRDSLDALRVQGENRRTELECKQDQLQSDAAKQAVQTVLLQSKIDDANRQYAQQQADAAGSANPGQSAFRK